MEKRSKVLTIGASVAMVLSSAALSISSYIGIFDGKQDMDTQEREIATELSSIAFESLGTSRDVIFDCEISDLEERFMPKENYGWSIPAPLPGSNV
ncbi:MAG: hypothetical protein QG623_222, partial [Patescibacteria group bacterium]|nr:hypothetical protein [Patescibacteria group bacterium]